MRYLIVLFLWTATADRTSDRNALLAADRALASTCAAFTDSAGYLHPDAPLIRGARNISAFLAGDTSMRNVVRTPAYADVSSDGTLGYTYGWTRTTAERGKYLACWRKLSEGWRVSAYARSKPIPMADSVPLPVPPRAANDETFGGRADPAELLRVDSAFPPIAILPARKAPLPTLP